LIVLFGLQLTFTTQHLKTLDASEIAAAKKREDFFIANDLTAINMVREIAAGFEANNAPVEAQVISSKLNIPAELNEKVLNHLVSAGIIVKTSQPKEGFMPAREPEEIKLSQISEAVSAVSFAQSPVDQPGNLQQLTQEQRDSLKRHNIRELLE